MDFEARLGDAAPGRVAVLGVFHCLKTGLFPAAEAGIETPAVLALPVT